MKFAMEVATFRSSLLTALFISISLYCQAQCVNRTELLALADSSLLQSDYVIQIKNLSLVLAKWEHCRYLKDSSYVNLMLERAKARYRTDDVNTAIQDIEQMLRLYNGPHAYLKTEDQVKAYYRLGFYWKKLNEFDKAIEASEKAVKIGEHLPTSQWVSFSYVTLAYANYSAGEFQKAVGYAERGMYQAERIKDTIAYLENSGEKIKALMSLAYGKAVEKELSVSIAVARRSPTMSSYLAYFLVQKARMELKHSNRKNALVFYNEALQINLANKAEKNVVENYIEIGYRFYESREYEKALTNYQAALARVVDPYLKLLLLGNIGEVYWQQKRHTKALDYYRMALNNIIPSFSKRPVTDLPDAKLIRRASQKEYVLTVIQNVANTWLDYAKATNNSQRLQYALETYQLADEMIDFMRWEHTGQLSKLYWREHTRSMYERAIETCFRLNNTKQAFRFFEKSRAAMLADKLNELGARQQLSLQQAEEERRLQRDVSSQQAALANATYGTPAHDSALVEMGKRQRSLDEFLKRLEKSNPAYYRYKYDTTTTSLSNLQIHLKQQKASFITYFVGDSTLYVLGVTPDTTMLYQQPLRQYQRDMRKFMGLLNTSEALNRKANYDTFLTLGNGLYQQLLAPLKLPAGRVIVSPDGSFVPFETLSRSTGKADYLVNDYAFSYTYSARLLLKNKIGNKAGANVSREFLGIAPVTFASSLKQVKLPNSDKSLERIAERFHSPELLMHDAATRREFLTKATNTNIIQLFTHATADSSAQEPTLYFADSTLRLSELGDGDLSNVRLVVLAACKTGIGANQRGEGVFSLARGFAAIGVPSVLTTLWSVQNEATYSLTELFYKYLDEGQPKDIALQLAKQEWLNKADLSDKSPNIWAGMIVVGDTQPLSRANKGLCTALIPLMTFGAWAWQRKKHKPI